MVHKIISPNHLSCTVGIDQPGFECGFPLLVFGINSDFALKSNIERKN
jgi:hypothetical protein